MRRESVFLALVVLIGLSSGLCQAQARLSQEEAVNRALQLRAFLRAEGERVSADEGLKKQAGLPEPRIPVPERKSPARSDLWSRRGHAGDDQSAARLIGKRRA